MASDLTKLIYMCPPFKAVRTFNTRPSFIKLRVVFDVENQNQNPLVWSIFYSRDSLGLGWITVKRDKRITIPIHEAQSVVFSIKDIDFNKDQMFRTWLPLNLCIRTRKSRVEILKQLGSQAVRYFIMNPTKMNVCIPRMLVFKEDKSTLSYAFEIIDGDDPRTIACSIGNENILHTSEHSTKGILCSPIFGLGGDSEYRDDDSRDRRYDDYGIRESSSESEEDEGKNEVISVTENMPELSSPTNERIFRPSYESIDPLEEASKIPDTPAEIKDIPFSLTKSPRQNKGKTVIVEKQPRARRTKSQPQPHQVDAI
jgi:hypothetical protein